MHATVPWRRMQVRSKRMLMLFPLHGSERNGLVSLEAKRKHVRLFLCFCVSCSCTAVIAVTVVFPLSAVHGHPTCDLLLNAWAITGTECANPSQPHNVMNS